MEHKRELHYHVKDNFGVITDPIDEDFISRDEAIISPELEHPQILKHSEMLSNLFAHDKPDDYALVTEKGFQPHPGVFRAVYLGIHFACVLHEAAGLSADRIYLSYGFTPSDGEEETIATIMTNVRTITERYLAANPSVEAMINYYIPNIDSTGRYSEAAEIATALTCAQIQFAAELAEHRHDIDSWGNSTLE